MYIIPALIAFVITAFILLRTAQTNSQSKTFTVMVLVFLIHHAFEVLGFIQFFKDGQILFFLKTFYVVTIWFLSIIFIYAIEVSKLNSRTITTALISVSLLLSVITLFGSYIVAGSNSLGYVMTAIKGNHYYLFQTFAVFCLIGTISTLFIGYKKAHNHIIAIQCAYLILAFAPLVLTLIMLIALMALGIKINAIALIPITSTLFLMITAKSESQHKLTDIRRFMPFSKERQTSKEISELYSLYTQDRISYREFMNQIESLLVTHKYNKNGYNASATAKSMGMPRSSLYSIFNRLKIDIKDQ